MTPEERREEYLRRIRSGIISVDEIRASMGYPQIGTATAAFLRLNKTMTNFKRTLGVVMKNLRQLLVYQTHRTAIKHYDIPESDIRRIVYLGDGKGRVQLWNGRCVDICLDEFERRHEQRRS